MSFAVSARRSVPWLLAAAVGMLVASFFVHPATGGAAGYPGPIARPGIPGGPLNATVNVGGTSASAWFCGFRAGSDVRFAVNGRSQSGAAVADKNGCVLLSVTVGAGPSLSFNTFGSSGPSSIGPFSAIFGLNGIIVTGIGGPGPYSGQTVGLSGSITVPSIPDKTTSTTTTTQGQTNQTTAPIAPGTAPGATTAPTNTPTTAPTETPTTEPGSSGQNTTLPPFDPATASEGEQNAGAVALVAGAAAAAAAAGAAGAAAAHAGAP